MPICLPVLKYVPHATRDTNRKAYAAGLGLESKQYVKRDGSKGYSICATNGRGPEVFTPCAMRSRWSNATVDDVTGFYDNFPASGLLPCLTEDYPSERDPLCQKFRQKIEEHDNITRQSLIDSGMSEKEYKELMITESVLIPRRTPGGNISVSHCFPLHDPDSHAGWCATCNMTAKRGEPGFCVEEKHGMKIPNNPDEVAIVYPDRGWGFCDKHCNLDELRPHFSEGEVKKVVLTVFNETMCKKLGWRVNKSQMYLKDKKATVNVITELCAASITRINVSKISYDNSTENFYRYDEKTSKEAPAETDLRSMRIQNTGLADETLKHFIETNEYVVGGEDSCQGDSGGPLWAYEPMGRDKNKKQKEQQWAVLLGVVSRGTACARRNYPGIYTRIKKYLGWIWRTTGGPTKTYTYTRSPHKHMDAFTNGEEGKEFIVYPGCN